MSYNTEMQSNNAELQEILDAVRLFPKVEWSARNVKTAPLLWHKKNKR